MAVQASSMQEKKCANCGKVKPISEFHKKETGKFGVASWCKLCACSRQRGYSRPPSYMRVDVSLAQYGFKGCSCRVEYEGVTVDMEFDRVLFAGGDFSPETKKKMTKAIHKAFEAKMPFPPREEDIYFNLSL